VPCPPDREELGRATWTLLHAVAAYYPDAPSAAERGAAAALVSALCALYPCAHCRERLVADVAASAPRTESRAALARWVCEQHNAVNEALGKRAFPCELAALDERWRTGAAGCWPDADAGQAEASLGRAAAAQEAAERADGR
jgi:FAD-linked sulfhydryl oxidase